MKLLCGSVKCKALMTVPKGFKLPFVDKMLSLKILLVSEALKNFYLFKKAQTNKTFFKKEKKALSFFE